MAHERVEKIIALALQDLGIEVPSIHIEHPTEISMGDYSTNVAMMCAKKEGKNPRELAEMLVEKMVEHKGTAIEHIEVAGPGFINFFFSKKFYAETLKDILALDGAWGRNEENDGRDVMVEFTDPNPFKVLHIGHMMSNTIGESIARLIEFTGANVVRANYQGDVGPHVAKTLWGLQNGHGSNKTPKELGIAYAAGAAAYEENKEAINAINKAVYEKSDPGLMALYSEGRKVSLEHFEEIYKVLGTSFDRYFFESEVWETGIDIVKKNLGNVFEESDGAIVFKGDLHDKSLHTRVFVNSEGLPTYEAKEIGLAYKKKEVGDFDVSISITGKEQTEYFKVVKKAVELIDPTLGKAMTHMSHGLMVLPTGKMSSRTGDVVAAEDLIAEVVEAVKKVESDREVESKHETAQIIAIAALKYIILRQASFKDVVYDIEKAVSFEGDSGPYLQYAHTRAQAILKKAEEGSDELVNEGNTTEVEKLLYRFPEVVSLSAKSYEVHHITNYLTELAGAFNSFYANNRIIGGENESYNLALTRAFALTMRQGLYILGINVPEKM